MPGKHRLVTNNSLWFLIFALVGCTHTQSTPATITPISVTVATLSKEPSAPPVATKTSPMLTSIAPSVPSCKGNGVPVSPAPDFSLEGGIVYFRPGEYSILGGNPLMELRLTIPDP